MDDHESLYLKKLKFPPGAYSGWTASYLGNLRVAILIIMGILFYGLIGLLNLPRRVNPEVKIPIVFISAVLPGASPQDMETLVTIPIEDAVTGISGTTDIQSNSGENISMTTIEFESDINPDKARDEVQSAVDSVILPVDMEEPQIIALDFEDVPVWNFTLTGKTDFATLNKLAREIKNSLEDLPSVGKVNLTGNEIQDIEITLKPHIIAETGAQVMQLTSAVRSALTAYPSGKVTTGQSTISVAIDPLIQSVNDIRTTKVTLGNTNYKLGDIADIVLKSKPDQLQTLIQRPNGNPQRAINFSVFKISDVNVDKAAREAKNTVNNKLENYPLDFEIITSIDFDQEISETFADLLNNFAASVALVFITLFLFLGIRQALIASLVIPLSFLFTFGFLHTQGQTLSFISIFSLLLAQGMIVDDAIVIIAAMTDYYRTGKFTPLQTAILVWRDYVIPILTSNLTNIWSFLPLLLATGIIGEFIEIIPVTVIISLVGSTAISLILTIPLMSVVLDPRIPRRVTIALGIIVFSSITGLFGWMFYGNPLFLPITITFILFLLTTWITRRHLSARVRQAYLDLKPNVGFSAYLRRVVTSGAFSIKSPISIYRKILHDVLNYSSARRKVTIGVILFSFFSYLLVPLGLVVNEFFPRTESDVLYASLELPPGTSIAVTTRESKNILDNIVNTPGVSYAVAQTGAQIEMGSVGTGLEENRAAFTIHLPDEDKREIKSSHLADTLRDKFEKFTRGKLFIVEQSAGPPSGADVQITFLGPDLDQLSKYADNAIVYLERVDGVTNIDKSIKPGIGKLTFIPDQNRLQTEGLTLSEIGIWLRVNTTDLPSGNIRLEEEETDIVIRTTDGRINPESLQAIGIPRPNGQNLPLTSLGTWQLSPNPTLITRLNGKRSISVTAAVESGFNIPAIGQNLEKFVAGPLELTDGYSFRTGGINEENQKSVNSILQSMLIAGLLIAGTMVVQLKSFRKAIIVMLVIPLAVSGVFIMFALTGTPLSFPALIGVLALFGIVVKNSILIVDKIDQNVSVGIPFSQAVADGAASRLEPIIFSSVTNIIGLIPITLSDPLWRGLGGAIIAGLTFSGSITLLFIPVIYYSWFNSQYKTTNTVKRRRS